VSSDKILPVSVLETTASIDSSPEKIVRVLHVDDDAFSLKTTKQCLELKGNLLVETAHSASEAMKKMKQEKFDVVVSDYQMPDKDGLELLMELRANENMIPFILFTGKGSEEVAVKALNLGAFRYVDKQGDPEEVYSELSTGIQEASGQWHEQEKLHESEEWFRAIYDHQQNGIIIIDPSTHTITNVNLAALELIGARKEQLVGRVCHTFVCPAERGKCPVTDLGQTVNRADEVLIKLNSARLPILKAVKKVTIAGKEYLIESFVDITERKRVEEELRESHQRFRALFSENPEAVVFCDKDFHIVDINPSFTALMGYCLDEVKGKDIIDMVAPDCLKQEANLNRQKLKGHFECNGVPRRKDGSQVNVSLSGASVAVNGNIVGYVAVCKDLSDIVFANEELNRMFKEQNRMLSTTTLLNEKLRVTGSLTRHDARNKLAAITGYAYLAKKHLVGNDDVRSYLLRIEEVTKNIVRILDFAKTYEMLGNQERVSVNVGKMVQDAASLFAELKGVTVVNECNGFEVLSDSLLMELFHNLIDNSLKYGEKITQIRIYTQKGQDDTVELVYEDDGVGIDPNMKGMLFQKGFGKGTGYGLYLIKRICEMYGWAIQENGEPGKGARFVIKRMYLAHEIDPPIFGAFSVK
jgi:PAS domain S-box-containing protein